MKHKFTAGAMSGYKEEGIWELSWQRYNLVQDLIKKMPENQKQKESEKWDAIFKQDGLIK